MHTICHLHIHNYVRTLKLLHDLNFKVHYQGVCQIVLCKTSYYLLGCWNMISYVMYWRIVATSIIYTCCHLYAVWYSSLLLHTLNHSTEYTSMFCCTFCKRSCFNHLNNNYVFYTKLFDILPDDETVRFKTCRSFIVLI